MAGTSINYAHAAGIYSIAGAVIFAIVYAPLLGLFFFKSIRQPTYVFIVLTFFCFVRIIAFILRAVLAGSSSAAHNEHVLIAEEVIYSVSFFGMLYSAYTLVLDRESLIDMDVIMSYSPGPAKLLFRIMRARMVIRAALMAAVVIGIIGSVDYETASTLSSINSAVNLRSASVYIFLAVACLLTVNTIVLSAATLGGVQKKPAQAEADQETHYSTSGAFVLLAIAALILAREAFYAGTEHNLSRQNNEHWWYPFSAVTELIAAMLFLVPGLVPPRRELPAETRELAFIS
ncbi:uncharacterized protein FIBRA_05066 [Fibroporia radiculosa]|uniref:Uncharacterized protein n=1 Tax=Fibroporia radiculosa TaxID=599839 RepID=J4IAI1_9APHY|nr:uncharacterized protein FIBRA_05066 [Fibroporia radiculosa]CCM02951.1 predicted protein [Fibroporia radiculosa]